MTQVGADFAGPLVLDTSAYSHFRAGDERVLDFIVAAQILILPTIVLGELEAGFILGRRERENRMLLAEFLGERFVSVMQVSSPIAHRYAQLFADLRRAGTPIPINDIWIAATTFDCGGHLLTFDGHFEQIAHLDCTVLTPLGTTG